ncbi:phosphatidylinositol/phosphatidylcholine transfer protein SFH11-like protein [Tanacetum coccineum]
MGETLRFSHSNKKLELRISATHNFPKSRLLGSLANKSSKKTLKCVTSMKVSMAAKGDIGTFLLTTAALEIVRRFSSSHCPFIWRGLQTLQILNCPPFKWLQKWAPFTGLVKGMQALSKPLMFLAVATGLFDEPVSAKGKLSGPSTEPTGLSSELATQDTRLVSKVSRGVAMEDWLGELYAELNKQGITIPERVTEDELRRFYAVSEGDFTRFLSSVKKTIRWRQKYSLFSPQELEDWVNLVFWHQSDVMQRPCLIIRVGLAGSALALKGQAQFVKAVVSQVEYGVLNLLDAEHPQMTVLMDCGGLSPFGFPVKTFRSCALLLQDHYPNRLGCLLVVRLPSVARVITQTLFQVLKPRTRQKLKIVGQDYLEVLSKYFDEFPPFLGGNCGCPKCVNVVETVGQKKTMELGEHHVNGTSSGSELVAASSGSELVAVSSGSELDAGTSIDISRQPVRITAVGALLLWVCVVFILGVYYHMFPQLYSRSGS